MTSEELRTLCSALGFVAVTMSDQVSGFDDGDAAVRARRMAELIEEFCLDAAAHRREAEEEAEASPDYTTAESR